MKLWIHITGFAGLIVFLYGLISAIFYSNIIWYTYFVIGGTFFLGYVNYRLNNKSIIKNIQENKLGVIKTYLFFLLMTIMFELVGRFLLNLWYFPYFGFVEIIIHVFLIGYPFILFFINETLVMLKKWISSTILVIILATLINAFLSEIPNTFAWEWIYTIPYINFEILQINIVVIFSWLFLILVPPIANKLKIIR